MSYVFSLSQLLAVVQDTLDAQFYGQAFWVRCEVTDVKKYETKNWCFCKLLEKKAGRITAECAGVFWQTGYQHIRRFEKATGQEFANGIAISALATIRFHPQYGFKLEILEIDLGFALGQMELARQQTLQKLLEAHPGEIVQTDEQYLTPNNRLPLPRLILRVALITANHSDGQRDFIRELAENPYGYRFKITGFYTTIQGETAAAGMVKQLEQVAAQQHLYDVVALVRGGGSQTDLKPFDDYLLAKTIAFFPLPVLTGIGHDRNTSIADLMARQYKVPTKVAATLVAHTHHTALELLQLQERLQERVAQRLEDRRQMLEKYDQLLQWMIPNRVAVKKQQLQQWAQLLHLGGQRLLQQRQQQLHHLHHQLHSTTQRTLRLTRATLQQQARLVEQLSPETILQRGFAIAMQQGRIVTRTTGVQQHIPLYTRLADGTIASTIDEIHMQDAAGDAPAGTAPIFVNP